MGERAPASARGAPRARGRREQVGRGHPLEHPSDRPPARAELRRRHFPRRVRAALHVVPSMPPSRCPTESAAIRRVTESPRVYGLPSASGFANFDLSRPLIRSVYRPRRLPSPPTIKSSPTPTRQTDRPCRDSW